MRGRNSDWMASLCTSRVRHFDTVKELIGLGHPVVISQASGKDGKCEPPPDECTQLRDYLRMLINEDGVLIDVEDVAKRYVPQLTSLPLARQF